MHRFRDYLSANPTIPNRRRVRRFERASSPLLILPSAMLVLSLAHYYPQQRQFLAAWLGLAMIYTGSILFTKYKFRPDSWFVKRESLALHTIVGILAISALQLYVIWSTKPSLPRFDLLAFWGLYLVPMFIVSRHGSTLQWSIANLTSVLLIAVPRLVAMEFLGWSPFRADIVIGLLTQIVFLEVFSFAYHNLVRQSRESMFLLETSQQTSTLLAEANTFRDAYEKVAHKIQSLYQPDDVDVFILLREPDSNHLRVVGAAGKERRYWENLKLDGNGITSAVLKSGNPICARDLENSQWRNIVFRPEGFEDAVSELAVPIRYQGSIIGVLDVESPRKDEFDDHDIIIIQGFADSLAISFGHFLSIDASTREAYKLTPEIIEAGGEHTDFESWFRDVATAACSNLRANGIIMVRLASGTRYPLSPISIWPRPLAKIIRVSARSLSVQSIIWRAIRVWEIKIWDKPHEWINSVDAGDKLIYQKLVDSGVHAVAFIPIGSEENPLMAAFCTFNDERVLGDVQRLAFLAFAAAVEKSYQALQIWPTETKRKGISVHRILASSTQKLFAQIDAAERRNFDSNPSRFLNKIRQGIRELREQLKRETVGDRYLLDEIELTQALTSAGREFEELRPESLRITFSDIQALEDDPLVLRQIYFDFIVEAIANSVEHGKASLVEVSVARSVDRVQIEIADNGGGIPKNVDKSKPFGIYYYSRQLKLELDADTEICDADPRGTRVILRIPMIPMEVMP